MIVKSFEIRSYKSCIKTKLEVESDLTALIGLNGAGKSNLMTGMFLLKKIFKSNSYKRISKENSTRCKIIVEVLFKKKPVFITVNTNYETDDRNADAINPELVEFDLSNIFPGVSKFIFPIKLAKRGEASFGSKYYGYIIEEHNKNLWKPINKDLTKISKVVETIISDLGSINYYSAIQFSDPSRCPVYFEFEENTFLPRSSTAVHARFINSLFFGFKDNSSDYLQFLSIVGKEGLGLIDSLDFDEIVMPSTSFEIKSGGSIKAIQKNRLLIVPRFKIGNNNLSPNQLSEGTFKTLALIYYIISDSSKILLIEEPEVCIHHGLLLSIITLIKYRSRSKQIIISTHSDYVLDLLKPENIVLVQKDSKKGSLVKKLSKELTKNEYDALKLYLSTTGNLGEYWKEGGFNG